MGGKEVKHTVIFQAFNINYTDDKPRPYTSSQADIGGVDVSDMPAVMNSNEMLTDNPLPLSLLHPSHLYLSSLQSQLT